LRNPAALTETAPAAFKASFEPFTPPQGSRQGPQCGWWSSPAVRSDLTVEQVAKAMEWSMTKIIWIEEQNCGRGLKLGTQRSDLLICLVRAWVVTCPCGRSCART
jgi:hypothetical protein